MPELSDSVNLQCLSALGPPTRIPKQRAQNLRIQSLKSELKTYRSTLGLQVLSSGSAGFEFGLCRFWARYFELHVCRF